MLKPLHIGMSGTSYKSGGLNRFVKEITKAQSNLGIYSEILGESVHHSRDKQLSVALRNRLAKPPFFPELMQESFLRNFDVLDLHFAKTALPMTYLKFPKVVHFHGPWFLEAKAMRESRMKVLAKRMIEQFVYNRNGIFVALSNAFADVLIKHFEVDHRNVHVIAPGIDISPFKETSTEEAGLRQKFSISMNQPLLISVRRLVPRMGLEILIDSLSQLSHPPKTLIIGEGPLKQTLLKRIIDLEMQGTIELTGYLSDLEVHAAYKMASASIIPSIELEGFGLSAIESMAHGTPVIATNVGGLKEVMEGLPDDFLVKPNSISDLKESIKSFFASSHDYKDMFIDHSKKYDWKRVVNETNDVYLRATSI